MADIGQAGSASAGLEAQDEGGALVLYLSGDIDVTNAGTVRSAIDAALSSHTKQVIFDLVGLQFMDSSGIALIVSVARQVPGMQVRNPSTIVRRLIELSGLAETFRIAPLDRAVRAATSSLAAPDAVKLVVEIGVTPRQCFPLRPLSATTASRSTAI